MSQSRPTGFNLLSVPPPRQAGAALVVGLVMLILITIISLAAARSQTMEARMAGNLNNRNLAMQSAEAGLRTAENGLQMAIYTGFQGNTAGQYLYTPGVTSGAAPYLQSGIWGSSTAIQTGPVLSSDSAQASTFIIEQLPPVARPGDPLSTRQYSNDPHAVVYRITAQATGADNTAAITLQSIYR